MMAVAYAPHVRSRHDQATGWMVNLTAAIVLAATAYTCWLMFAPHAGVMEFQVKALTAQPSPGGLLEWQVSYCVDRFVAGSGMSISRELELQNHKTLIPLGRIDYTITQPCESFTRAIILPLELPVASYKFVAHTTLTVNPLREIHQRFESAVFEVR